MTNQIKPELKSGQSRVATGEIILIRHAETDSPGTLNGRHDVGLAAMPSPVSLPMSHLWVSPAKRARLTAEGLFPGVRQQVDERLWEQDFGVWDGVPFSDIPDIGELSKRALADLKAEGGESFHDVVARVRPALAEAADVAMASDSPVVIVAHAGVLRAALAVAMEETAPALAFQIAFLGATRLVCFDSGFAIKAVNERLA